jgi:hypothetical protein|tara:strand:+ start:120 stop:377 length:258 start_codon:yes stop_codon:yes gene_type:complete
MNLQKFKRMTDACSHYYTRIDFKLVKETPKAIKLETREGIRIWYPKKTMRGVKNIEADIYTGYFWKPILFENIDKERDRIRLEDI